MASPTTDKMNSIFKREKYENCIYKLNPGLLSRHYAECLTLLLQFPRSGRSLGLLMIEDCRRHCIASNRKSDSFSPLEGARLLVGSEKRAFNSCTGFTGLAAGFLGRGLVDLSTLGRPVDPLEGIIRCGDEIAGRDRNSELTSS